MNQVDQYEEELTNMTDSEGELSDVEDAPSGLSKSEFTCAFCMEIMIEPTTLMCGHSFCRGCLARWYVHNRESNRGRKECAQCKQEWVGYPKTNITLRNTIETLFPEETDKRKEALIDSDVHCMIKDFEKYLSQEQGNRSESSTQQQGGRRQVIIRGPIGFWKGVMVATGVALVAWLLGWLLGGPTEPQLTEKPLMSWTQDDVQVWLTDLGTWTANQTQLAFSENNIDGLMLSAMEDEDLDDLLGEITSLQRRAFWMALQGLKEAGVKPATDLWQYKHLHLFRSLYVVNTMQIMPRTVFGLLYLVDYTDGFVPMILTINQKHKSPEETLEQYYSKTQSVTWGQYVSFWPLAMLCPYLTSVDFLRNSLLMTNNLPTALLSVYFCLIMTAIEVVKLGNWYSYAGSVRVGKLSKAYIGQLAGHVVFTLLVYLFWNWIPMIVCNCLFYFNIYVTPGINTYRLYCIVKGRPWKSDDIRAQ